MAFILLINVFALLSLDAPHGMLGTLGKESRSPLPQPHSTTALDSEYPDIAESGSQGPQSWPGGEQSPELRSRPGVDQGW